MAINILICLFIIYTTLWEKPDYRADEYNNIYNHYDDYKLNMFQ